MYRIFDLTVACLRTKRLLLLSALSLALLGASCSGLSEKVHDEKAQAPVAASRFPGVELTPDIFYDILLGEIAQQRGQFDVALDALMRAATTTRDPRLIELAARVAVYAKQQDEAIRAALLWVEVEPDDALPHEVLGSILLAAERPAEAQLHFEKAMNLYGSALGSAYRRLADVLGRAKNRVAAVELMESLVNLHPQRADAYYYLAQLARRLQQPEKAMAAIDRALILRPEWEGAAVFKMQQLAAGQEAAQVEAFGEAYLTEYPAANKLHLIYARYLLDHDQLDKARGHFKQVVENDPQDADSSFAVGLLSIQAEQFREAERYLKRTLRLNPGNDQARLYLGQIAIERRQYDKAVKWYRAVKEGEQYFGAQLRLAVAISKKGELDQALEHLRGIMPVTEKEKVRLTLTEEQMLREAKQLSAAMEAINAALREIPDQKDLLYSRALLAAQMNMIEVAEGDIRKVLAKDPKNAQALNALGYTLADQTDRYQEAFELIKQALALKPDDPYILDSMGWVQYRLGNHEAAIVYLTRAMEKHPDAEIAAHLGEVLWIAGDRAGARSAWQQGLEVGPDNDVLRATIKRFEQ